MRTKSLTVIAMLVLSACTSNAASGSQTLTLHAKFAPDRLGASTTIYFGFEIHAGGHPVPATGINLYLPGGLGFATNSLGLESCNRGVLQKYGPDGCSLDSVVGHGTATGLLPISPEEVTEKATVTAVLGGSSGGQLELLFYAEAVSPVSAQLVLPSLLETEGGQFSGHLDTAVPLIPTWPTGPDVAITRFMSSFGPAGLTYYLHRDGRTIRYHPRGVTVPKSCPRGGFPFAATVTFEDGSSARANSTAPCPGKGPRAEADHHMR